MNQGLANKTTLLNKLAGLWAGEKPSAQGHQRPAGRLPPRIQAEIENQQYRSEMLVGFTQLVLVAVFFILYLVTPATSSPDAPVRAAPLGLSLFSILIMLRLWFTVTKQLNNWILGFSVVAEMLLLMFTIWAYHLQFEQPPSIYLKTYADCNVRRAVTDVQSAACQGQSTS